MSIQNLFIAEMLKKAQEADPDTKPYNPNRPQSQGSVSSDRQRRIDEDTKQFGPPRQVASNLVMALRQAAGDNSPDLAKPKAFYVMGNSNVPAEPFTIKDVESLKNLFDYIIKNNITKDGSIPFVWKTDASHTAQQIVKDHPNAVGYNLFNTTPTSTGGPKPTNTYAMESYFADKDLLKEFLQQLQSESKDNPILGTTTAALIQAANVSFKPEDKLDANAKPNIGSNIPDYQLLDAFNSLNDENYGKLIEDKFPSNTPYTYKIFGSDVKSPDAFKRWIARTGIKDDDGLSMSGNDIDNFNICFILNSLYNRARTLQSHLEPNSQFKSFIDSYATSTLSYLAQQVQCNISSPNKPGKDKEKSGTTTTTTTTDADKKKNQEQGQAGDSTFPPETVQKLRILADRLNPINTLSTQDTVPILAIKDMLQYLMSSSLLNGDFLQAAQTGVQSVDSIYSSLGQLGNWRELGVIYMRQESKSYYVSLMKRQGTFNQNAALFHDSFVQLFNTLGTVTRGLKSALAKDPSFSSLTTRLESLISNWQYSLGSFTPDQLAQYAGYQK